MRKQYLGIWFLLLVIWIGGSSYMYVCEIRNDCCCNDDQNVQNLAPIEKFTPPQMSIEHQGNYWDFREEFYFVRKNDQPKLSKNSYKELKSIAK